MRAEDLMSHPPITCHVNDTLSIAAQLMWNNDCGSVEVTNDEGKLVGMITDRDICMCALTQGRPLDELLVNTAMAKHVVSARTNATIAELEQLMAEHRVRRIPVVDADGKPIGMVSLHDLAIESVQPDSSMKNGAAKVAHTLAAVSQPRPPGKAA
ncbi:MAG TPA: CBS domain-containing protein [Kofleriaceae bacterium]|nr:CBS domain-containing protein [Kofleriaceae bacterium]